MNLTRTKEKFSVDEEFPGLLKLNVEHTIKESKGEAHYTGPKISPVAWQQVLSFFKWTYSTAHSESQVRLFVNAASREWMAWAFPQEARTGMSARELDTPDSKKQRADIPPEWVYFGTVHHHCSSGAFQSGTDLANENNQDGLHITVGRMDSSTLHDMHARFYLRGLGFEPDMSLFWDVGDDMREVCPPDVLDKVARWQMCKPVSVPFPDKWKENVIEVKVATSAGTYGSYGSIPVNRPWDNVGRTNVGLTIFEHRRLAAKEVLEDALEEGIDIEDLKKMLEYMWDDLTCRSIVRACIAYSVDAEDILKNIDSEQLALVNSTAAGNGKGHHTTGGQSQIGFGSHCDWGYGSGSVMD